MKVPKSTSILQKQLKCEISRSQVIDILGYSPDNMSTMTNIGHNSLLTFSLEYTNLHHSDPQKAHIDVSCNIYMGGVMSYIYVGVSL